MSQRLIGVVLLLLGAALTYLCIIDPLQAADRRDDKISLFMKGSTLCPVLLGFGIAYCLLGSRVTSLFGTREQPKPLAYVVGIALVVVGFGLYFWLKAALEAKGYQF